MLLLLTNTTLNMNSNIKALMATWTYSLCYKDMPMPRIHSLLQYRNKITGHM